MLSLSKSCLLILCSAFFSLPVHNPAISQTRSPSAEMQWQLLPTGRLHYSLNGTWYAAGAQSTVQVPVNVPGILSVNQDRRLNRDFFIPDSLRNTAIVLHILGINYQCRIQLNGSPIASHAGGYTSFDFELKPEAVRYGANNTLSIEIDGELTTRTTLPFKHRPQGWQHEIGILRDIYLEARPAVAIAELRVEQQFENEYQDARLLLQVDVQAFSEIADSTGHQQQFEIYCEVSESDAGAPIAASAPRKLNFAGATTTSEQLVVEIKNVQKWSPKKPALYHLEVFLKSVGESVDRLSFPIGIREFKAEGKRFQLNGQPFFVKGVTWHEDLAGLSGAELTKAIETIIARLKALGVNVLRVVGHPPHPQLVARCSQEGIGLFEEIPLYYPNGVQMQNEPVQELAAQQLSEMQLRDRLQPAVLAWGLASHVDESQSTTRELLETLAKQARNKDARPVYYVRRGCRETAPLSSVDFVLSDHFGETRPQMNMHSDALPEVPIFGFWAEGGEIGRKQQASQRKRSEEEERQAEQLERVIEFYRSSWPDSAGFFVQSLTDWRGSQPLLAAGSSRNAFIYPGGLIDSDGHVRIGFRMVSAYHLNERKPQISPGKTQSKQPIVFTLTGIVAILLFLFFLNRDKKLRVQLRRAFVHPHGLYSDLFENRKTPTFLTILLGAFQGVIMALLMTSVFYVFRESMLFDEIVSLLVISSTVKRSVIWLVWHPGWMIFVLTCCYFFLMLGFAVLLRVIGFFFRSTLNSFQYFTLVFWTAVIYLPLALVAPIFYRLLPDPEIAFYSVVVIAIFGFWHFMRMQRSLRVFYIISPMNALLFCLILTGAVLGAVFLYYNQSQAILDYWDYYAGLIR